MSSEEITGVSFGFYDPEDVAAMSVKQIDVSLTFDEFGIPISGGLYDPALGPTSAHGNEICPTCHLGYRACPGHVGHIDLSVPVYNPLTFDALTKLLKFKCAHCHHLKQSEWNVCKFVCKIGLIDTGKWKEALALERYLQEKDGAGYGDDSPNMSEGEHVSLMKKKLKKYQKSIQKYQKEVVAGTKKRLILHTHERQSRQAIIKEFMSSFPHPSRPCLNCRSYSPILRKDGHTKMFELELSETQIMKNLENGKVRDLATEKIMQEEIIRINKMRNISNNQDQVQALNDEMQHSSGSDSDSDSDSDSNSDSGNSSTSDSDSEEEGAARKKYKQDRNEKYLAPSYVQRHLRILWQFESAALSLIWKHAAPSSAAIAPSFTSTAQQGVDFFFMETIPVCPSRFRPPNVMGGMTIEHPLNVYLKKVIKINEEMVSISGALTFKKKKKSKTVEASSSSSDDDDDASNDSKSDTSSEEEEEEEEEEIDPRNIKTSSDLAKLWIELQENVNCLLDSAKSSTPDPPHGVRQVLEKKEGLFRRNMMGKRVNFACRSVISPDPFIDTHEVGLPLRFAKKLTFPEPVTTFNFDMLRKMVVNGASKHPGANYVEDEFGNKKDLARLDEDARIALYV